MSEHLYLISISLIPATILIVFGMKYLSAGYQARAQSAADARYRDLARQAADLQSQNAAMLSSIGADVTAIGARLMAVEKILKEVG